MTKKESSKCICVMIPKSSETLDPHMSLKLRQPRHSRLTSLISGGHSNHPLCSILVHFIPCSSPIVQLRQIKELLLLTKEAVDNASRHAHQVDPPRQGIEGVGGRLPGEIVRVQDLAAQRRGLDVLAEDRRMRLEVVESLEEVAVALSCRGAAWKSGILDHNRVVLRLPEVVATRDVGVNRGDGWERFACFLVLGGVLVGGVASAPHLRDKEGVMVGGMLDAGEGLLIVRLVSAGDGGRSAVHGAASLIALFITLDNIYREVFVSKGLRYYWT